MRGRILKFIIACAALVGVATSAYAFPDHEVLGIDGQPPFNFGFTDTATSFYLKSNRILLETYGLTLAVVDLAYYALTDPQPFDITTDDDTTNDSPFTSSAYLSASDKVLVGQERGHILIYSLAAPADAPVDVIIAEGDSLGPIVVDTLQAFAYITDNTAQTINVLNLSTLTVDTVVTVVVPNQTSFFFTDGEYNATTAEVLFSTDKGGVAVLPAGGTAASVINVDTVAGDYLSGMTLTPDDAFIFVADATATALVKIDAGAGTILDTIDLTPNTDLADAEATHVTNPDATYVYVAGGQGVSIVDAGSDLVLDMGTEGIAGDPLPISPVPQWLAASTDGYVYMSLATTDMGIVAANPWITIGSVVYSSGGTSLGIGEAVTITFQSDIDGTYELRSGGDVDQSGALLTDINGATSGAVVADTDVAVTIPYDANSSLFIEGDNDIFVFVTDASSNVGRRATTVSVDTPPSVITLQSTGFGNQRVYVVFDRLTAEDMSHYNVYVDPDPDAVITKAEIAATITQPDSGATVTAEVGSLTNGTTYYIAVEGVDLGGNVSVARAITLPSGARASATPQETVGPAGYAGEKGCTLVQDAGRISIMGYVLLVGALLVLASWSKVQGARCKVPTSQHKTLNKCGRIFFLMLMLWCYALPAGAQEVVETEVGPATNPPSPQWGSFEVKGGFWMPTASKTTKFFDTCCNVVAKLQGGVLIHGRYGIEQGVGFMYKKGDAVGVDNGAASMDQFTLILIPMDTSFAWRLDYWTWRYIIPYFKGGLDYAYFRESTAGTTTQGVKYGMHGVGGLQFPLAQYSDDAAMMDQKYGINDVHFTIEALYQWINNFGGGGLDLSGWIFSAGLLFTF